MRPFLFLLRLLFAFSFLFSAYTKFIAPGFFEITLMDQGLSPTRVIAGHLSRFFIGLEFSLGLLLLLPFYTRRLARFSFLLLTGFTVHLIYLWSIGDTENCGCFGEMIAMTPLQSIAKNIFLLAISLLLFKKSPKSTRSNRLPLLFSFVVITRMWIALPLPNHNEMSFVDYTHFEYRGRVDLTQGEKLIVVFNLDCEHCQEAAKILAELKREQENLPEVFVLFYSEGATTVDEFETLTQSQFPYSFIDVNTFFDLIGDSPPRLYFLSEGKVTQFWDKAFKTNLAKRFDLN